MSFTWCSLWIKLVPTRYKRELFGMTALASLFKHLYLLLFYTRGMFRVFFTKADKGERGYLYFHNFLRLPPPLPILYSWNLENSIYSVFLVHLFCISKLHHRNKWDRDTIFESSKISNALNFILLKLLIMLLDIHIHMYCISYGKST